MGLPNPCTPAGSSVGQRRASLLAKIAGLRRPVAGLFTIAVAAALGFAITITEFTPSRLGFMSFGDPLMAPEWQIVWQVNAPTITVALFHFGTGVFGDPFWAIGNTELQCRLSAIAPAHTILIFAYS